MLGTREESYFDDFLGCYCCELGTVSDGVGAVQTCTGPEDDVYGRKGELL